LPCTYSTDIPSFFAVRQTVPVQLHGEMHVAYNMRLLCTCMFYMSYTRAWYCRCAMNVNLILSLPLLCLP
jgi:hypothetical protein